MGGFIVRRVRLAAGGLVLLALLLASGGTAAAQTGNFCVADYVSGPVCTANDVRIEAMTPVAIVEACNEGTIGEVEVIFEAMVRAGAANRYDIGYFVALDGGSALTGNSCYHGYFEPPLTSSPIYGDYNVDGIPDLHDSSWWNSDGDSCGDILGNTQIFKTLIPLRLACADNSPDPLGAADVHVCTSWDNNSNSVCTGLGGAVPGTGSKCSCTYIQFQFTPSAIRLLSAGASGQPAGAAPLLAAGMLLAAGSVVVLRRGRRDA